jgi:ubiquinone/menaquinone biosynthesis C-methylase UbiE
VTQGFDLPGAAVPVIDYEGSQYRTDFWSGQGRDYEDAAERLALSRLLPVTGRRIAEIGAGFGRLADLYLGYDQIVLMDYSRTLLQDAARQWGDDPRFVFVAGNLYSLPLAAGVLDSLVMVRVMHHLADVPAALAQVRRVVHSQSRLVLEYANKRNLKALARWAARRQQWSPLDPQPVEFVELNFDFHPRWMAEQMTRAGLTVEKRFAVSHFRAGGIKRRVSPALLARADNALFRVGGAYPVSPSVFVQAKAPGSGSRTVAGVGNDEVGRIFCCPTCRHEGMVLESAERVSCPACGAAYARVQQVWDFKDRIV